MEKAEAARGDPGGLQCCLLIELDGEAEEGNGGGSLTWWAATFCSLDG